ncbi:MAG: hypothetical protein IIA45_15235, partial [Bacteroidetes bacterium]|nr:hypothetical protein [Bacteroidota bacterium]
LGGMARSSVLALVKLIEKKHYQNGVAQNALWVLTDQASITNITGKDYEMVHELRQFVCNATGRKMPPPYVTEASKPIYTISVEVEYSLEENGLITILLYDQNGNIIKELFRDRFHDKGTHRYNYEMNGISLPTDNYYLKLYQDGVLKLQIRSILK